MFDNASWVEWVLAVLTGAGFLFGLWLIWQRQLDLVALDYKKILNGRRIQARANRRVEVEKVIFFALFGNLALYLMTQPPAPGSGGGPSAAALLLTLAVFGSTVVFVAGSILSLREQRQLFQGKLVQQDREREAAAALEQRDAVRDAGRDEGRDPIRDEARDIARDLEREEGEQK